MPKKGFVKKKAYQRAIHRKIKAVMVNQPEGTWKAADPVRHKQELQT